MCPYGRDVAPWWLLLPQRCAVCDVPGSGLCVTCRASLVRLSPPLCERCGAPGAWPVRRCVECAGRRLAFASARAAVVYDAAARRFVHAWKEGGRRDLSSVAGCLVAEVVRRPAAEVVAFVPSDPARRRARGHAPAESLARALSSHWQMPVASLLSRTRRLERQRGRSSVERRANVRGAFTTTCAAPQVVCLVDDVFTTGATAASCASALRRAGARSVDVVCFARTLRGG